MKKERINEWELATLWRCPHCKAEYKHMSNYCPDCGKALIYEKEVEETEEDNSDE